MIETERLIINSLDCNSADIHDMFLWHNDAESQKYLHIGPFKLEYDFRLYYVNVISHGQKTYIAKIKNIDDDAVACCCRLSGNSLIWLCNPKYRGNGYTTELVSAIINTFNLHNVIANIDRCNIASQKVAEKVGFVRTDMRSISSGKTIYEYTYQK